ncbi:MAG: excinuclease ABC subunit UvrA [Mollicutes bacterium PWAP]|nr:excinuclease ABC subunit UvrA [Mollicutes bacterium PWAP]
MADNLKYITVRGAKENNLKNIDVTIPKNSLVVLTGVSGSGKSSLAFNTIYEEGRRRYVESLSSYARQFLGNSKKPLVDSIDGLQPAISIEQKTTNNNPRSTVGTVTEIYDYLRLLYARVGEAFCPTHNIKVVSETNEQILKQIFKNNLGEKIILSSPVVINEKGSHQDVFESLKKEGFIRAIVNGKTIRLSEEIKLRKNSRHYIDVIIDRTLIEEERRSRIAEGMEVAIKFSDGIVKVTNEFGQIRNYNKKASCPEGDFSLPKLETRLFSFNSPQGMCSECKGLGLSLRTDVKKLILGEKTINTGGVTYFKNLIGSENLEWQTFEALLDFYEIDRNTKMKDLSKKVINYIIEGSEHVISYQTVSKTGLVREYSRIIEGLSDKIERKHINSGSEMVRNWFKKNFLSEIKCKKCLGARVNENARSILINDKNIYEFTLLPIKEAFDFIENLAFHGSNVEVAKLIINEIASRLEFLINVGLDYISLDRKAESLSGGESQRIRLATQIGSNLTGVLYVLDEPSIGLHQRDNDRLISTLKHMVSIGNTLFVVEHDEDTIREADFIVDIGPLAGDRGGDLVVAGTLEEVKLAKNSITGDYLSGRKKIEIPKKIRKGNGKKITIIGARENNLKNISVDIPLGKFVAVTGVSGSGKSTLINTILSKGIESKLTNPFNVAGDHDSIDGIKNIDKLIRVTQSPIGRTPRSNPATYTGVFDEIRDLFAKITLSKERGYEKGRFSFNVEGGRCDKCRGDGVIKVEMNFLPDVWVNCDICDGKRYNVETLEVKFKEKSIFDVLQMRVEAAALFFENQPKIVDKLNTIIEVGLGYITLGQKATTLSGGEAQRVKLATYLQKKPTGKTLFVLDEPTTGLHQHDVKKLLEVLERIVEGGDTVLVIEHNLDVIKSVDHVIDLGPEGGIEGGEIVAEGTPKQVSKIKNSYTGQYLKKIFKK